MTSSLEKMEQSTVSVELETKVMQNFASVLKVMAMENARWQDPKLETGRDPSMKYTGPDFNLSFFHVGEMLVGFKAWPAHLKTFMYQCVILLLTN